MSRAVYPSKHLEQRRPRTICLIALKKLQWSSSRTVEAFCMTTSGPDSSSPLSSLLRPKTLPTMPRGLGTGHSCAFFLIKAFSSSEMCRGIRISPSGPELSSIGASVVRGRLLRLPFSMTSIFESASLTWGAGHGMRCGMPTTRKETRRVVPKREVVRRDRGWRWGVMTPVEGAGKDFNAESRSSSWGHYDRLVLQVEEVRQMMIVHTLILQFSCYTVTDSNCWKMEMVVVMKAFLEPRPTGMWQYPARILESFEPLMRFLHQSLQTLLGPSNTACTLDSL